MNASLSLHVVRPIWYRGLLLTCRIVNLRVDVIWRGYDWFSDVVTDVPLFYFIEMKQVASMTGC